MNDLILTARCKGKPEEYVTLADCSLKAAVCTLSGDGSVSSPFIREVTITADQDFLGVIRIAMPSHCGQPRFFLPGFMYGTNRGESPLVVDSKCPRLRKQDELPASSWWMVRSDRLSHPCAFIWGNGRLTGFAAAPYFVRCGDERKPWTPGMQGEFDQYAGFGCSVTPEEIIYTLGYENAPWFFLDAHQYSPRAPLKDNCFTLPAGETITVQLCCFDLPAPDERSLHDALKQVYARFHESPARKCTVQDTVASIAGAICKDAWLPDHHAYSGFVFDRGDHFEYNPLPSISWTSGLSAAVPMLLSAYRLKNETMRAQALDCIEQMTQELEQKHYHRPLPQDVRVRLFMHAASMLERNTEGFPLSMEPEHEALLQENVSWFEQLQSLIHRCFAPFGKPIPRAEIFYFMLSLPQRIEEPSQANRAEEKNNDRRN